MGLKRSEADAVILVTGGASGIGAACATVAARGGARVVVADRNIADARAVANDIGASAVAIDVTDPDIVGGVVAELDANDAGISGLIHCAGVLQRPLPPGQLGMREWDIVVDVNLRGAYIVASAVGQTMCRRGAGAVTLVASVAGMRSAPLHSYGPAKAAVIHMAACLAAEWGPSGVRVNAVSPGFTQTPALDRGLSGRVLVKEHMIGSAALGRLVKAEEVAAAAWFLTSDAGSGITGINLPVDAGYLVATPWQAYGGLRGSQ